MQYKLVYTLLKIIPQKSDHYNAAAQINTDLNALCQFGCPWSIEFAPHKTLSVIISLKTDVSEHPPLFLNDYSISEVNSTNILGFTFDSTFTWQDHIVKVLTCGKQRLGQLYRCRNLLNSHDLSILYKSWVRPVIEYGYVLYSGTAPSHLHRLDTLQTRVEHMSDSKFTSLGDCRNAAIMGLVCRLLAGKGRGNLSIFCPSFVSNITRDFTIMTLLVI